MASQLVNCFELLCLAPRTHLEIVGPFAGAMALHDRKFILSDIVRLSHRKRLHSFSLLPFAPRTHLKIVGPFG